MRQMLQLPTLTGKPLAHNENNRDNFVTLNVAFQKPKTQAARDSLTQQGGGGGGVFHNPGERL